MQKQSRHLSWKMPAALLLSLVLLGVAAISSPGDWKIIVAVASAPVLVETLLAFVSGPRLRRVLSIVRVVTTAVILCAAVLRILIARDRGSSPSWLLVIPAVGAVAAVLTVEWRAWRQSESDDRVALASLTQAVVVAACAIAVTTNLEMAS
jgi:hypothetical protein